MSVTRAVSRSLLAVALLAAPSLARAQAFGLNEIGSCAVARGYANTAVPCADASVIYWNPAAALTLEGNSFLLGAAAISVKGDYTQDTTLARYKADPPTSYVPHFFYSYHAANSKYALGIGVYVPSGLTSQWPSDFPGRFLAQKASIQTTYIQPNFAYQLSPRWSIGAGPIWGTSVVDLRQGLDASTQFAQPGVTFGNLGIPRYTEFAEAHLHGHASAFGAQAGLLGRIDSVWSLGLRYMTAMTFKYSNATASFTKVSTGLTLAAGNPYGAPAGTPFDNLFTSQFSGSGALVNGGASTSIVHPAQAAAGLGYTGFQNWTFDLDYEWVGWKQLSHITITPTNPATPTTNILMDYKNTSTFRFGGERAFDNGWKLRAGVAVATSAAPAETVTPLLPEQPRGYYNAGLAIPIVTHWALDAAYSHLATSGARGRVDDRTSESETAAQLNDGVYHLSANIVSLSLRISY